MLEKEIKVFINQDEYNTLINEFDFTKTYIQTNYYYFNKEMVDNLTIRIREKNSKLMLQIKIPRSINKSLHMKEEYEKEFESIPQYINKDLIAELANIELKNDVYYIGKLITERRINEEYQGIEISLDKNQYLDTIDYELEIEYVGVYPQKVIDRIQKLNIKVDREVDGKNTRYMNRLEEVKDSESNY